MVIVIKRNLFGDKQPRFATSPTRLVRRWLGCIVALLLCYSGSALGSGAYNASLQNQAQQYTYGKAIFFARPPFDQFNGCSRCHQGSNSLSHKRLKSFGLTLEHYQAHCNTQSGCTSDQLEPEHWQALMYYLKMRYRLK